MAKFCKKCGSRLDEKTGLCPICDNQLTENSSKEVNNTSKEKDEFSKVSEKPLSKKEEKKKRKAEKKAEKGKAKKVKRAQLTVRQKIKRLFIKLIAILLAGTIFACCIIGILTYFNILNAPFITEIMMHLGIINDGKNISEIQQFECLSGEFTARIIDNQDDALAAIADVADVLGITDVNEEFSVCQEDTVLDNKYYRFSQEYKGIPVYGRSVIVNTDADGNSLMLSGNYSNLGKVNTTVSVEEAEAINIVENFYDEDIVVFSGGLNIYSLYDVSPQLAWKICIGNQFGLYSYFISAQNGTVLDIIPVSLTENYTYDNGTMTSINAEGQRESKKLDVYMKSEQYNLADIIRNIEVYQMQGTFFWFFSKNNNEVNVVQWDGKFPKYQQEVDALSNVQIAYDYFDKKLFHKSTDGNGKADIYIYTDWGFNKDAQNISGVNYYDNAASWSNTQENYTGILVGKKCNNKYTLSAYLDVMAHEYTHAVIEFSCKLSGKGESGAINEGYADIFGEIVEEWKDGTCDWIHNIESPRNIANPINSNNPTEIGDQYWEDSFDYEDDNGNVHNNSTVISHAAYLMWKGIDGSSAFESLSTEELADLFYSTLFSLPSDCTFSQFRTLLQNTADIMYKQGKLSYKQRMCVSNAMFQVGIYPTAMTYTVTEDADLYVYDINEELYDNYSISVAEVDLVNMPQGPGISPQSKEIGNYISKTSEPFKISLKLGIYRIVITNLANELESQTFYLSVMKNGSDSLSIHTIFGDVPIDQNKVDILEKLPSDAVEFNGHYYYLYDSDAVTSWEEAKLYCEQQNGYLATLTSEEENDFVYYYMKQKGYNSAYFGFYDNGYNDWRWVTDEPVKYMNWHESEPNSYRENYAMFYYKYSDGTWNDGDFGDTIVNNDRNTFICEWGEYQTKAEDTIKEPNKTTSGERDIVITLDVSGSMGGTPMEETKKASINFIDTILEEDASIGVVTYDSYADWVSDFSVDKNYLKNIVSEIWTGGGTNIEAGLSTAYSMLDSSGAKKKIIVLMSDGEPNEGKLGDELVSYADEIKNDGVFIYTLGFFENMGGGKSSAQALMEKIASDGCHYEVASADDLVFFFEDIADQINGQKYIYVRIACPVDVSVSYNGETLSSLPEELNLRTDFGTLAFEESEDDYSENDDRIKVLRLKEGVDYNLQITGTGHGIMDYTIGFMDENGDYSDFRRFENIKITKKTVIDTVASVSDESVLNIDEDGDGKYDLKYRAEQNGYGEEIKHNRWFFAMAAGCLVIFVLFNILIVCKTHKKRKER